MDKNDPKDGLSIRISFNLSGKDFKPGWYINYFPHEDRTENDVIEWFNNCRRYAEEKYKSRKD